MKVFKATHFDLSCTMGSGVFQYEIGVPVTAENSKCGSAGLHACEYVLDCARYYGLGGGNRFFLAEAEGDIAEDGSNTRIACTRLTLLRELEPRQIAWYALLYMVQHPRRAGWQVKSTGVEAAADRAEALQPDEVAIARGERPVVKGVLGSHLGLIQESAGTIKDARLITIGYTDGVEPGTWYTLEGRELKEAGNEKP